MRLTVIVPTYNRAALLERALEHLTRAQAATGVPCAIVVVDNNSSDGTRDVAARHDVRTVFEPCQGLSHARNAGIAAALADDAGERRDHILAFTDDDVQVTPDWCSTLVRAFEARRDVDCVGGRVLPQWRGRPPSWLSREHWAPLALQDHGERVQDFDARRPLCLVGANVAFRADVFDRIGLFSPDVQRVADGIGSTEDHELLLRLYAAGGRALYLPELLVTTEVPGDRLTRRYHRRWHRGHGRFHALMRTPDMERSRRGRLFGVPAHLYRGAARDAACWLRLRLAGEDAQAFVRETRLWFFSGFLRERCPCLPRR